MGDCKMAICQFGLFSPVAAIALSFGYAVGWGAFMMPGRAFLPGAGPLGTMDDLHALFS